MHFETLPSTGTDGVDSKPHSQVLTFLTIRFPFRNKSDEKTREELTVRKVTVGLQDNKIDG